MEDVSSSPKERAQAGEHWMVTASRRSPRCRASQVAPMTWQSEPNEKQPQQKQPMYEPRMLPLGASYTSSTPTQLTIHEPAPTHTEATASSCRTFAQVSRKGRGSEGIVGIRYFDPSDKELVGYYLLKKHAGTLTPQEKALISDLNIYKSNPYELQARSCRGWHDSFYFHASGLGQAYRTDTCRGRDICRKVQGYTGSWKADPATKIVCEYEGCKVEGRKRLCKYQETQGSSRQLQPKMYEYEILTVDGKDHLKQDRILLYKVLKVEDQMCSTSPHSATDADAELVSPDTFPPFVENRQGGASLSGSETCKICNLHDMNNAIAALVSNARLAIIDDVQFSEDFSSTGICVSNFCISLKVKAHDSSVASVKHTCVLEGAECSASGALLWTNIDAGQTSGQITGGESASRPAGSSPSDVFMHGTNERRDQHVASPHWTDQPGGIAEIDCSQDEDLADTYSLATGLTQQEVSMYLLCNRLFIM
eukprot:SM000025S08474  [mRNA]  locus=s25:926637:929349:- [translate_table: standard]